jgi:hypothetical protein
MNSSRERLWLKQGRSPDPFYWDLWANLEHLRESYMEYCAQEHFDPEASEEERVASLDNQV